MNFYIIVFQYTDGYIRFGVSIYKNRCDAEKVLKHYKNISGDAYGTFKSIGIETHETYSV